jgi:hypothetical protein
MVVHHEQLDAALDVLGAQRRSQALQCGGVAADRDHHACHRAGTAGRD